MHKKHHPRVQPSIAIALVITVMGAACTKKESPAPVKQPQPVAFKAQAPIPVTLTLQKEEGSTGRSSPITSNYRPQVRFADGSSEATCAVQLPASAPSLAPGQTIDASLACDADVRVEQNKREFVALEGGKQVGRGTVQLP
jgi:translation elongation factor EF-Tu-like GTPase